MKVSELKELVEKHTNEDVIDFEAIAESVNKETNDLIAKKQPNIEELEKASISKFLKEQGFEKAEDFKQFVSASKTKEEDYKKQVEEIQSKYADYDNLKSQKQFLELGVKDKVKQKLLQVMFEESGEENFEEYATKQIEANPKLYTEVKSVQTAVSTTNTPQSSSKLGWEKLLEENKGVKLD